MSQTINDLPSGQYIEHRDELLLAFQTVREHTVALTAPLSAEDMQLQSMPDASPVKWHLAHTSWFFEAFILQQYRTGFDWHNPLFARLFNSYYNVIGEQYPRPLRGMISRPSLDEVHRYRQFVNEAMMGLMSQCATAVLLDIAPLLVLGINHEQQHQELILTDAKHALFQNPAFPAMFDQHVPPAEPADFQWLAVAGGEVHTGYAGEGFCFDNELPRHCVLLDDFSIANRPVSNAQWLEFMDADGYGRALLWLADGWAWRNQQAISAPLYWVLRDGGWQHFTLTGLQPLDLAAPVTHISYYEAEAYAHWAGQRLPSENEWEHARRSLDRDHLVHVHNQRWEWTASPYSPYPGFRAASGNVGEYNGKFMINQMVLRGASRATPHEHSRPSYRNFFYPHARWQFSSLRLVQDHA